jgi:hypothetical protein
VARWDRDRDTGRHERAATAWLQRHVGRGVEIEARITVVLRSRERQAGIESADRDVHPADASQA